MSEQTKATSFAVVLALQVCFAHPIISTGLQDLCVSRRHRLSPTHLKVPMPWVFTVRGGGEVDSATNAPPNSTSVKPLEIPWEPILSKPEARDLRRFKMYAACMAIVLAWVTTGTAFYAWFYKWPISQSFFYAVDAGMSIGFCTDVSETEVSSRAFTIVYILLGASCVGGALYLFMDDALEGMDETSHREYKLLLEQDAFRRADKNHTGTLTLGEFRELLEWSGYSLSQEEFQLLWKKFDRKNRGFIAYDKFIGRYRGIHKVMQTSSALYSKNKFKRTAAQGWELLKTLCSIEFRIYVIFILWIAMGVTWGVIDQQWDPITATHFAVSALATGGLTAPPVGEDGILPARAAIFCGVFCLFGIPLFYLTLGHFARLLVESQARDVEQEAISKPLSLEEFEFAKHLCTTDSVVHLSDYIVLCFLRQGKTSLETLKLIKKQFELMDSDHSGVLTLEQATAIDKQS